MNLALQKALLAADLMPTEKLVGLCIAYHIHGKRKFSKVRQDTIAHECGVSLATVKRALLALRHAEFIDVRKTGRSCVYQGIVKDLRLYDSSPMSYQTAHQRASRYELDTEFSTKAEEENKRQDAAFKREQRNGRRTENAG